MAHERPARARDRRLRRLVQPSPAALLDRLQHAGGVRARVLDAPRARVRTVAGSGRPNGHRSTRRSHLGLSDGWTGVIALDEEKINYSTTNDSPSNPGKSKARECFLVAKRARGAQSPWQVKWTTQDNPPARAAEVPLRCPGDPAVPPAARAVALASASRGCRKRSRRRSRSTLLVGRTAGVSELVGIRPAASPARTRASVSRHVSRGRSSRVTPARWKGKCRPGPGDTAPMDERQQRRRRRRTAAFAGRCRSRPGPGPPRRRGGATAAGARSGEAVASAATSYFQPQRRGAQQATIAAPSRPGRRSNRQCFRRCDAAPAHQQSSRSSPPDDSYAADPAVRRDDVGLLQSGVMQPSAIGAADDRCDRGRSRSSRALWRRAARNAAPVLTMAPPLVAIVAPTAWP